MPRLTMPSRATAPHPVRSVEVLGLAVAVLVVMLPVTMVVAVLKPLVQDAFGVGDFGTSLFMSVNMIGAVLAAPAAGLLADRTGRRRLLATSALALDGLCLLALANAPSYASLMAVRLVEGAAHVTVLSLVLAAGSDLGRHGHRGRIMGLLGGTLTLGVAAGAPIGGQIGGQDPTLPLVAGAVLAFLGVPLLLIALPADARRADPRPARRRALDLLRERRALAVPYAFAFVDRFTVGFFISVFPLFLANVRGTSPSGTGFLLALFLIPFALLCYPMGRLAERVSRIWLLGGGSLGYGALVPLVPALPPAALPWLMVALGVLSSVMFVPTLLLTASLAGPDLKTTAMAGFNAAGSLGFLVGPTVAGALVDLVGPPAGYQAAFLVAGLSEVLCVALTLRALAALDRGP